MRQWERICLDSIIDHEEPASESLLGRVQRVASGNLCHSHGEQGLVLTDEFAYFDTLFHNLTHSGSTRSITISSDLHHFRHRIMWKGLSGWSASDSVPTDNADFCGFAAAALDYQRD